MKFGGNNESPKLVDNDDGPTDPGRRKFLRHAGAAIGAAYSVSIFSNPAWEYIRETLNTEGVEKEIADRINFLSQYGITVHFDSKEVKANGGSNIGEITLGEQLSLAERLDALEGVARTVVKYPKSYIKNNVKWNEILLLNNLGRIGGRYDTLGDSLNGFVIKELFPGLIVVQKEKKDLTNYVESNFGWGSVDELEKTLHHEMFHLSDPNSRFREELGKTLGELKREETLLEGVIEKRQKMVAVAAEKWPTPSESALFDVQWDRINNSITKNEPRSTEGYATPYGKKNAGEDRATVAQAVFCDGDLEKKILTDPVLAEKVRRVKEFYCVATNGIMCGEYWRVVARDDNKHIANYVQRKELEAELKNKNYQT